MVNHGLKQHQDNITLYVDELRSKGYHVVNLHSKAPDAVAVKDNKLYAIEVLGLDYIPKRGWDHLTVVQRKKEYYAMFDDILFKIYLRDKKILSELEKQSKKIVNDFIKGGM